jgi:hypothetical protein
MFCRNCQTQVAIADAPCPKCGSAPLAGTAFCPRCGAGSMAGQVACAQCGTMLGPTPVPLPTNTIPPMYIAPSSLPLPTYYNPSAFTTSDGKAVASLVLGIIGFFLWCLPLFACPLGIIGAIMGALALKGPQRVTAIWGLTLSIFCLVAAVINGAYSAYLGATGQNPLLNMMMRR